MSDKKLPEPPMRVYGYIHITDPIHRTVGRGHPDPLWWLSFDLGRKFMYLPLAWECAPDRIEVIPHPRNDPAAVTHIEQAKRPTGGE